MSNNTSGLSRPVCAEKERIIQEILEAHRRIASLQIRRMEMVLSANPEGDPPMTSELRNAREARRSLMEELRAHIEEHRC